MSRGSWIVTPDKFLTAKQVAQLRNHLTEQRSSRLQDRQILRDAALIETLLATGLRVSEVCDLVVGDLFLDAGHVLVRRGKGNKARLVTVPASLCEYLRDFVTSNLAHGVSTKSDTPLFKSQRGGNLTRSAVHRVWKKALGDAGLPTTWGVHSTRHSYATELYRKTRDLRLTQRQLGHSSPVITQVYASLIDDDVRRGVEMLWA
jgi:site-specific recombinase XerD